MVRKINPVNIELLDEGGIHYNEYRYCYDYWKSMKNLSTVDDDSDTNIIRFATTPDDW